MAKKQCLPNMVVGVDEAGRGPLAGVVTACALCLRKNPPFTVKDSKELTHHLRVQIFNWLVDNAVFFVDIATIQEIDRHNILEATFLAFNRAISGILKKASYLSKATFIIDGNFFRTNLNLNYICMEKADKKVKEVSCASIIAKVTRDYLMQVASYLYPQWNFSKHKGYPTKEHFSLIDRHAISPLHRQSFFPCNDKKGSFLRRKGL